MNREKENGLRKHILEYLRGKYNHEGRKAVDDWFNKLDMTKPAHTVDQDDLSKAKARIKSMIDERIKKPDNKSSRFQRMEMTGRKKTYMIAASLALIALLIISLNHISLRSMGKQAGDDLIASTQIRTVPNGKKLQISLPDGSVIHINSGSELRFPDKMGSGPREVFLKGEAYFEIKRDPERPFVVHTSEVKTTVLGTSFNIRSFEEEKNISVTVASGLVQIEVQNSQNLVPVLLQSDEKAVWWRESESLSRESYASYSAYSWKDNILQFDNRSLGEVAQILERWYNIQVKFGSEEISNYYFMGKFENPELQNVLDAICYATGVEYEAAGKEITFKRP